MERELVTITTPIGKHEVKIKEWLTGGERRKIRSALLQNVNFDIKPDEDGNKETKEDVSYSLSGNTIDAIKDSTLEATVYSIDGKTDNILETILQMHEKDYDFVVSEVEKMSSEISEQDKKK